jgi:hypothetical protein
MNANDLCSNCRHLEACHSSNGCSLCACREFVFEDENLRLLDTLKRNRENERSRFEAWVKREHPDRWPNPALDGTYHLPNGGYYNFLLNSMWEAWQAARS